MNGVSHLTPACTCSPPTPSSPALRATGNAAGASRRDGCVGSAAWTRRVAASSQPVSSLSPRWKAVGPCPAPAPPAFPPHYIRLLPSTPERTRVSRRERAAVGRATAGRVGESSSTSFPGAGGVPGSPVRHSRTEKRREKNGTLAPSRGRPGRGGGGGRGWRNGARLVCHPPRTYAGTRAPLPPEDDAVGHRGGGYVT